MNELTENPEFLTQQIITYLGNKRSLLTEIEVQVQKIQRQLGKEKLRCADLFSGSGIVARLLKKYAKILIVNDLEKYSQILNSCYLTNPEEFNQERYLHLKDQILQRFRQEKIEGLIATHYAPQNDREIKPGERVFYTRENALRIDTFRYLIEEIVPEEMKRFYLAPLLTEASIHTNTSGVFKGFYKDKKTGLGCFGGSGRNALNRILGEIQLPTPIFSRFSCPVEIHQSNTEELVKELPSLDLVYLDPPYNQHPYGSNYFMLNLIIANRMEENLSPVSGIPKNWNRSSFNRRRSALDSLEAVVANLNTATIILSYNSEGLIAYDDIRRMLERYGSLETVEIPYNTFRGSRNLQQRSLHVNEFLFVLKK